MQIVYRYVFWRDGRVRSHEILEKATCKGKFNELWSVPLNRKIAMESAVFRKRWKWIGVRRRSETICLIESD